MLYTGFRINLKLTSYIAHENEGNLHWPSSFGFTVVFCFWKLYRVWINIIVGTCLLYHRISFTRTVQKITGSCQGHTTHPRCPCSADILIDYLRVVIKFLNLTSVLLILMSHITAHRNVSYEMCKYSVVDWSYYGVSWLLVNIFEQQSVEQSSTASLHLT